MPISAPHWAQIGAGSFWSGSCNNPPNSNGNRDFYQLLGFGKLSTFNELATRLEAFRAKVSSAASQCHDLTVLVAPASSPLSWIAWSPARPGRASPVPRLVLQVPGTGFTGTRTLPVSRSSVSPCLSRRSLVNSAVCAHISCLDSSRRATSICCSDRFGSARGHV